MTDTEPADRATLKAFIAFLIEQRRHFLALAAAYERLIEMYGGLSDTHAAGDEKDN